MATGILFIENYIAGGADKVASSLMRGLPFERLIVLINKDDDVSILLAGELPATVFIEKYNLLTIPNLLVGAKTHKIKIIRQILVVFSQLLRYPLFIFSIFYFYAKMVRLNPDVFIANNGGYPAGDYCRSATIAASLRSGIKVVHVVHNMAVASPWFRVGFEWFIDRLIDSRSTLVAVSERAAKQLNKVRWIKQNPIVVYNGVEMRPKKMAGKKGKVFTILNVGYFGLVKNQKLLIDVFASLVIKGHSEIRLTFIGAETEEGYQEECRKMVAELGVEKLVNFLGFMEEPEVWYQEADVFVLCSIIEGFPMTVLEAMRASTPVIATDVGGVGEQVSDGETGFIIREGDRKSLAEVLEIVISDENLCRRLGESGRKRFEERYTVETMISQYAKLLGLSGQNVISK